MRTRLLQFLPLLFVVGCASTPKRPEIWVDEHYIVHQENPKRSAIATIKVHAGVPKVGCIRLRDIYLDGRFGNQSELRRRAAMQFGSHVQLEILDGDTVGIPYDCYGIQKQMRVKYGLKVQAWRELASRFKKKGMTDEEIELKRKEIGAMWGIPQFKYEPKQD